MLPTKLLSKVVVQLVLLFLIGVFVSTVVVSSSLSARRTMATDSEVTIFDKIVKGEIPSEGVYEDDKCYAFRDINPTASVHIVLVPKNRDGLDRLINVG